MLSHVLIEEDGEYINFIFEGLVMTHIAYGDESIMILELHMSIEC
jgi:hypothetical protein